MSSTAEPSHDAKHDRRGVLLALAGVVVLLGALYLAGYFFLGNRIPAGIDVAGVDVGGQTRQEAEATLRRELLPHAYDTLRVLYEGEVHRIDPQQAGLSFDVETTVAEAGGARSWDPRQMVRVLVGSYDVDPVVDVDDAALEARISALAEEINVDPVEAAIAVTASGSPRVTRPEPGIAVNVPALRRALLGAFLRSSGPLELPTRVVEPQVDEDGVRSALSNVVQPALSGPVTLDLPVGDVRLPVSVYAPAFRMSVTEGELSPSLDAGTLARRLGPWMERLGRQPRDAMVVLRGGSPVVVPARSGIRLDPAEVADAVLPVLTETGRARIAKVNSTTARADFTTADAKALEIREPVSSFVTYYPHAEYRNINQGRAAQLINGTVLEPGDTFSFNDTVGERTRANGFVVGFVISNGVFAEDLGGGVSQVATTTFNAAFFAGLKDVTHTPHSFYIDRYPVGREATVAWPDVDLQFQDTTPYGVLIEAWVVPSTPSRSGEMHVRMWSTKYWNIGAGASNRYDITQPGVRYDSSKACVEQTGLPGFDVDVYRYFRKAGSAALVRKETMHTDYIPADTVTCTG